MQVSAFKEPLFVLALVFLLTNQNSEWPEALCVAWMVVMAAAGRRKGRADS